MISVGADPELFLLHRKTNTYVSAHNIVPGTKKDPVPIPNDPNGGTVQADGTAVEFNIRPAYSAKEFNNHINSALEGLKKMIGPDLKLVAKPSINYDLTYWNKDVPNSAKELGCDPDYNAYTGKANPRPTPPADMPSLRTGSGHIHIGWLDTMIDNPFEEEHFNDCRQLTMAMDIIVNDKQAHAWDSDTLRRKLYGERGAFRPKKYGVEYRVLSNAWLRSSDTITAVYNGTMYAVSMLLYGTDISKIKFDRDKYGYHQHPVMRHPNSAHNITYTPLTKEHGYNESHYKVYGHPALT